MQLTHLRSWLARQLERLEHLIDTFGASTMLLLLASLIVSLGMVFLNDSLITTTRAKTDELGRLDKLLTELWKTRTQLALAETSQQGYLLLHAEDYVQPYEEATQALNQHLQEIDHLLIRANLGENQDLQAQLNEVISAVSRKSAEMNVAMGFAKKRQFERAMAVVKLNDDLQERHRIESMVQRFEQQVQAYRSDLADSRNVSRSLTRIVVMLCPLLFISLVIVIVRRLLLELAEKAVLHRRLSDENQAYQTNIHALTQKLQGMALQAQTDIERERYQLSRELHDELGALLTAIKMDLSWAIKSLKDDVPQVTAKLAKTNQYVDRSINFKREIVQNLHPTMLKSFGLVASLQNLLAEAKARNGWVVDAILPEQALPINETIALIVYRITQESLNNCSKYAQASQISVHVLFDEQHLKLDISDNGVGFDPASLNSHTHGISGMRNRVESIGGHYAIHSQPGQGVHTSVLLPRLAMLENNAAVESKPHEPIDKKV